MFANVDRIPLSPTEVRRVGDSTFSLKYLLERCIRQPKGCLHLQSMMHCSALARVTLLEKQPLTGCITG